MNLKFYGKEVEYHGGELGVYVDKNITFAGMAPRYMVCNPLDLEMGARSIPQERFVETIKELHDLAENPPRFSPILVPVNFERQAQGLKNTEEFTAKVLEALGGQ